MSASGSILGVESLSSSSELVSSSELDVKEDFFSIEGFGEKVSSSSTPVGGAVSAVSMRGEDGVQIMFDSSSSEEGESSRFRLVLEYICKFNTKISLNCAKIYKYYCKKV